MDAQTKRYNLLLIFLSFSVFLFIAGTAIFATINAPSNQSEIVSAVNNNSDQELKDKIGQMIMIGFRGQEINQESNISRSIQELNLGGVILFDYDVPSKTQERNFSSSAQVRTLISNLQFYAKTPLFVAVDAEGGYVNRLKPEYGFKEVLSPADIGKKDDPKLAQSEAKKLADELAYIGVNMNFAPVVDLDINKNNPVIGKLERSYSEDPQKVFANSKIFIEEHRKDNIITVLKHFPGHGSSNNDTHYGIADITSTYDPKELIPYQELEKQNLVEAVMTAHVIDKNIDNTLPSTLSASFLDTVLKDKVGFKGIIVSDDMQMGAIIKEYGFQESIVKAINAGCDILIFANNNPEGYDEQIAQKVHQAIYESVKSGKISLDRINQAYLKVKELKAKYGIIANNWKKKAFSGVLKYINGL